ncbi:growth-regulating factor 4-like isoform X2 [Apium graveolens]|uniref:growth-regulating factor 4-like isoform X2 n=1 Tax=Apium graveolens TaxID=4045 RepID=UPI003D7AD281
MSSDLVSVAVAGEGFRPPFTAVQWQELEQQALVYKYLMAGLPVPPELVITIRRSFEALSARFFHHSTLGYFSYYGKKFDPEPGRCRRTDGKKWRCSKDAYLDSKYCERHMHRGRNRSRKPVESQSTSQSLPTVMQHITTGSSSGGIFQGSGSRNFQNLPLYPTIESETLCYGSNRLKLQMEQQSPYGIANKEYRYLQGPTPDANEHNSSPVVSGTVRGLGMDSNLNNAWPLLSSQVHSSPLLKSKNGSNLQENYNMDVPRVYECDDATVRNQRRKHCFFGNDSSSLGPVKHEHHLTRPFLDKCPKSMKSWPELDERCNKRASSTTQLSISIPVAPSAYSARIDSLDDVQTSC